MKSADIQGLLMVYKRMVKVKYLTLLKSLILQNRVGL